MIRNIKNLCGADIPDSVQSTVSGQNMLEVAAICEVINTLQSGTARHIGIDGSDGVGKSTLADAVGSNMRLPVIHLDDYLIRDKGGFLDFLQYERLQKDIEVAPKYIIEGVCLLEVLERIGVKIDFLIYVQRYHLGCWSDERELDVHEPLEQFIEKEREFANFLSAEKSKTGDLGLSEEVIRYHYAFRPHCHAHLIFRRDDR